MQVDGQSQSAHVGAATSNGMSGVNPVSKLPLSSTIPPIVQEAYASNNIKMQNGINSAITNGFSNGDNTVSGTVASSSTMQTGHKSEVNGVNKDRVDNYNVEGLDLTLYCGPLLNYRRMSKVLSETPVWHGTVLIVTSLPPSSSSLTPPLTLRCVGPVASATGPNGAGIDSSHPRRFESIKLYQDEHKAFWRYEIELPFQQFEARWEYDVGAGLSPDARQVTGQRVKRVFVVPARSQSMRIMFHSCNGFSVGTDEEAWNGPALWNDVLRMHDQQPFHVMIGGGDQIYNDSIRVDGPLREWTEMSNPRKRRNFPFTEDFRRRCDEYYYENYAKWYALEPFATANGQIPQLNIWDDHDIIDGFGSYVDHFMRCAVFRGIGGVAHKYYMLFQHHVAPPKSTFTTDSPGTVAKGDDFKIKRGVEDPTQANETYVYTEKTFDESYIVGPRPGPYVEERSRSIYCQLGARIAFLGIDGRTERTRHQITYPETYDLIFKKVDEALAANRNIKHLILLLGIPVAYPRLQWLENILRSPIIGPLRFLNRRFGIAGGLFNQFDGSVDLLDDLDDHFTAHQHKPERNQLIHRLQDLARRYSVRVTILGGDVHLGAIGRFFTRTKEGVPAECDHRYMVNVISSAITNKPPPNAVANLLARRNKIHKLDHNTHETLLEMFNHDPGHGHEGADQQHHVQTDSEVVDVVAAKTAASNHVTMPSRNYAILNEILPDDYVAATDGAVGNFSATDRANEITPQTNGVNNAANTNNIHTTNGNTIPSTNGVTSTGGQPKKLSYPPPQNFQPGTVNPRLPIHIGEKHAGTRHPAAPGLRPGAGTGAGASAGGTAALGVTSNSSDLKSVPPSPLPQAHPELTFGLDLSLRVEITRDDPEGRTQGYGMSIPALESLAVTGYEDSRRKGEDIANEYGTGAGFSVGKTAFRKEREFGGPGSQPRRRGKVGGPGANTGGALFGGSGGDGGGGGGGGGDGGGGGC